MKPSDHHWNQWVGQPVFKLKADGHGCEEQIEGKVVSYSPVSDRYVLRYSDGSSEGVSADEIGDYVPLLLQFPHTKRSSKKRRTQCCTGASDQRQGPTPPPVKRCKVQRPTAVAEEDTEPASAPEDVSPIASKFVQDILWALTTVLEVAGEKQRTLLATLDNRIEQPRAALARYIEEDGLDAVNRTLRKWATETGDSFGEGGNQPSQVTPLPDRDAADKVKVSRRAAKSTSRMISPCDRHLRELLSGKCGGVFSPTRTQPKEQHAPCNEEVDLQRRKLRRTQTASIAKHSIEVSPPPKTQAHLVDLTISDDEQDEGDGTAGARRQLRFGRTSTIVFSERDSVDVFRLELIRRKLAKQRKLPKQKPQV